MNRTRRDRRPQRWHFALLFLLLIGIGNANAANPWVHTFNPLRTLYVSTNGNGDGSEGNPMSFSNAINTALPGDLYLLKAGTYNGQRIMSRDGNSTNPIVWRADEGAAVIINGSLEVSGDHNWVWGFEIKDPNGSGTSDGIAVYGTGVHAINNIVHDIKGRVGIGTWNTGSGHVVYGNIVYKQVPNSNNPHNIYAQNDFATKGYSYIVDNMMLDAWDATGNTYNFHAYTQGSFISGFHLEKNISRKGKFLIGGTNLPADNEIVKGNYFYNAPAVFGYDVPAQVKFQDNYLGRTYLDTMNFWGAGEIVYPQPAQSIYTGNEIHFPPGNHIDFRTSAFMPGLCEGCPEIRSGDSFNNNVYSSPFGASFHADNNNAGNVNFTTWKSVAANAGNAFDTSSTVVTSTPNKVVVLPNEYETGRGHIVIYNWSLSSTVTVDLSSVLSSGANFEILDPRNMGNPVLEGTYTVPVNIPTGGSEFMALLVLGTGTAPPPPDTTPPDTNITSSFCGSTVTTTSVTVNWTGSDNVTPVGNLVYAYKLDSGSYSSYSSATSQTFNNLTEGSHTVSVKAKDEAGNVDPTPDQCTFTVDVGDTTPPVISNIQVINITTNSATVTWDTNEASDSQVEYGTSPCPCSTNTTLNTALVTAHSVNLSGLNSNTTYHYRVKSKDASGNLAISTDKTFTTANNPPPPPPPGSVVYYLEPEAGTLIMPMEDDGDGDASNHKFVKTATPDQGTANFVIDIPVAGTYIFWARVKAPNDTADSFYVSADGGAEDIFDCAIGTPSELYQWDRVNGRNGGGPGSLDPRTFTFSAGQHTLEFRGREPGTELDMLLVTNNLGFVPPANAANTVLYKILPKKMTTSTVKIKWRSEMPANSLVEYGTTTQYGTVTTLDTEMVEKHKVPLENLLPNTMYHFRVKSVDDTGTEWVSADFTFMTLP